MPSSWIIARRADGVSGRTTRGLVKQRVVGPFMQVLRSRVKPGGGFRLARNACALGSSLAEKVDGPPLVPPQADNVVAPTTTSARQRQTAGDLLTMIGTVVTFPSGRNAVATITPLCEEGAAGTRLPC
jgi:hypothetical protein